MLASKTVLIAALVCAGYFEAGHCPAEIPLDIAEWGQPSVAILGDGAWEDTPPTTPLAGFAAQQQARVDAAWPSFPDAGCTGCCPSCSSGFCSCARGAGDRRFFHLTDFNIHPTFSYLDDLAAWYNEFEFGSQTDIGPWEMENRTVINVADLPGTIALGPTNPFGTSGPSIGVRAQGFGDVLTGFFFSRKDSRRPGHLGIGPVFTFPSATNEILGSSKWTVGPGAHYSTRIGDDLVAGFIVWQSWTYAGDDAQKDVNQLFGKPFLIYELSEKWNLVYLPLGLSYSWKGSGNKATVPIGGGVRRLFEIHGQKMGFQVQLFDYVARKSKDPEYELRMTFEFLFDE